MKNVAVVGIQWGDEGKGKVIDFLSTFADVIVRFQGGPNAGHTIVVGNRKIILHLIPSGILREGKYCVIGNGVVVDLEVFEKELNELKSLGFVGEKEKRILISGNAHLILPYHKKLDLLRESKGKKIGTTGRGIGPAYEDKVSRMGIRVIDLFDRKLFREKVEENLKIKNFIFEKYYGEEGFKVKDILEKFDYYRDLLKDYVVDAVSFLLKCIEEKKSILFEGAQGSLLDVDHGTYPYVTSSNTIAGNICSGAGVPPQAIDYILGVMKAYTTRVGEGPFPTELKDERGEIIRQRGYEFGATTGRPRRCGWLDVVVAKRALRINGANGICLMKPDVLDVFDKIKICYAYRYENKILYEPPMSASELERCEPLYIEMDGWNRSTAGIRKEEDLPENAKKYFKKLEELLNSRVCMISSGPEREDTILLYNPFSNG